MIPFTRASCAWVESGAGFPNQGDFDSTCWLGGGQQEMAKPYSQDLRDRVIDAVKRGEMSRRAAARRYEISESVAIKWLERVERDGVNAGARLHRFPEQRCVNDADEKALEHGLVSW